MSKRPAIVLFDIDGTLIRAGGAGKRAITDAFFAVCGVPDAFDSQNFSGRTDPDILAVAANEHLDRELTSEEHQSILDAYLSRLKETLHSHPYVVLPGVVQALTLLSQTAHVALGLATGNVQPAAYLKLARGGLDRFFSFGGFGSDARCRATLTAVGFDRGFSVVAERSQTLFPFGSPASVTKIVVGDSPYDIRAAKAAGATSIALCTGWSTREELLMEQPDFLLENLLDTRWWLLI